MGHLPGKQQVGQLLRRGLTLRDDLQGAGRQAMLVGALHQQAAAHALQVQPVAALGHGHFQQAHVGLVLHDGQGVLAEAGGQQHFDELLGHGLGSVAVDRAVEGDDAAEGRGGIGREGAPVGLQRAVTNGHAAGVGVLDDDACRLLEGLHAFPGGIGISDVVVGQLLALQLLVGGQRARCGLCLAVEGGKLVRVLAIAHGLHTLELQGERGGQRRLAAVFGNGRQVVGHGAVVLRGMAVGLHRQVEAGGAGDSLLRLQLLQHRLVVGRIDDDGDTGVVLGGRAQHGRAPDVDVLDGFIERHAWAGHRLLERIQVDGQQVDAADPVLLEGCHVRRQVTPGQQAAMHLRMQRLHPAVQHLRKAGVVGNLDDGHAGLGQHPGRSARGQDLHAQGVQPACELQNTCLVENADQGPGDWCRGQIRGFVHPAGMNHDRHVSFLLDY